MERITNSGVKSLKINDLDDFAKNNNISLPPNFISLYLKYNGGILRDNDDVKKFLSIKYGKFNIEDVIKIHQTIENNIPKGYLPFASDWSDNPITYNLNVGDDYGKIIKFYFDNDEEPDILADSLEDLFGVKNINDL
jgi:hypothetical protein